MTELLVDDRGSAMRATWHDDELVLVLSVWHEGVCTGSVRLPPEEVARLGRYLLTSLARGVNAPTDDTPTHPPRG